VIGVPVISISYEFRVDLRTPFAGVFQFFKDYDTGAFGHHETVAVLVERPRGLLGFAVPC